jgi:hypothetical protein
MGAHEGDGDVSAQVRKLPPAWCKLPFSGNLCHPESVFFNRLLAGQGQEHGSGRPATGKTPMKGPEN